MAHVYEWVKAWAVLFIFSFSLGISLTMIKFLIIIIGEWSGMPREMKSEKGILWSVYRLLAQ